MMYLSKISLITKIAFLIVNKAESMLAVGRRNGQARLFVKEGAIFAQKATAGRNKKSTDG
jgi:hypothetical protein